MKRFLPLAICLVSLAACSAALTPTPTPTTSYRVSTPPQHHVIYKAKARPRSQPEPVIDSREWSVIEDRFITTHDAKVSAEALKIPQNEVAERLKQLKEQPAKTE